MIAIVKLADVLPKNLTDPIIDTYFRALEHYKINIVEKTMDQAATTYDRFPVPRLLKGDCLNLDRVENPIEQLEHIQTEEEKKLARIAGKATIKYLAILEDRRENKQSDDFIESEYNDIKKEIARTLFGNQGTTT